MNKAHGGNIYAASDALGRPAFGLIDMSASINPLGPPRGALSALRDMRPVPHYPDPQYSALKRAIANRYKLSEGSIITGAGSTELIFLLPRALRPPRVLVSAPTFSEYERAARLAGAAVEHVRCAAGYRVDVDAFARAMRGADMAFICNPCNPTASVLTRGEVLALAKAAKKHGCVLVVDEAFMDFVPEHSVLHRASGSLVVLRSLTKFYALAGLRVGFGAASPALISKLRNIKEPWTIGAQAANAAAAALDDAHYASRTLGLIRGELGYLGRGFDRLGIRRHPSEINYMLLEHGEAPRMAAELFERGILVRRCGNFHGLGKRHLRVAVRTRRENRLFIESLAQILGGSACRS